MKKLAFVASAFLLSSCATPHLYPVCFYNITPPSGHKADLLYVSLTDALSTSLGTGRDAKIAVSPDGRWLVASTTPSENTSVAAVWPRVGCIGTASDSDETRAEAACVDFIREFVSKGNYFSFGNARDARGIDIWNESSNPKEVVHCSPTTAAPALQSSAANATLGRPQARRQ